jgi:hypothetical protein
MQINSEEKKKQLSNNNNNNHLFAAGWRLNYFLNSNLPRICELRKIKTTLRILYQIDYYNFSILLFNEAS